MTSCSKLAGPPVLPFHEKVMYYIFFHLTIVFRKLYFLREIEYYLYHGLDWPQVGSENSHFGVNYQARL